MDKALIRATALCVVFVFAAAAARAGEELMPLVPAAVDKDAKKPKLNVNVIKLTLPPITNPTAAAKISGGENAVVAAPSFGKTDDDAAVASFIPAPPGDRPAKDAPASAPVSLVDIPAAPPASSTKTTTSIVAMPAMPATSSMTPAASMTVMAAMASTPSTTSAPSMASLSPYDIMPMAAPAVSAATDVANAANAMGTMVTISSATPTPTATFSPIDHIADIPGLVTPDLIARDKASSARPYTATTFSAQRDELLDLVAFDGVSSPQSLPISPDLPAMPMIGDSGVAVLEPFVIHEAPRKPPPEQIHLPPPLARETGSVIPPEHLAGMSSVRPPETAKPSQTLSLRPPPESARKPSASAGPSRAAPAAGSPLLSAPLGLSLTGSMPLTHSGYGMNGMGGMDGMAGMGMGGMGMGVPPPSHARRPILLDPAATRAMTSHSRAAPRRPPPPRKAPPLTERTVPNADPGDEQGFTMMRGIKNLLGP